MVERFAHAQALTRPVVPKIVITSPAGRLESALEEPPPGGPPPRAAVVCAHPQPLMGGTMANPTVVRTARALAAAGCPALRFNFRGVGKSAGAHSGGTHEPEDIGAAVAAMSAAYPGLPCWLVGYSFGAIMGSRWAPTDERIRAFVAIGFPLMMGYKLPDLGDRPLLCVQGERDRFGSGAAVAEAASSATRIHKTLIVPGAEHLFVGKTQVVGDMVAGEIDWLHQQSVGASQ